MPLASSATPTKPSCRSVLRDAEFSRSPGAGAAAKTKRGAAAAAGAAAPPPPSEFQKLRATLEQLKLDASQPASGRSSPYHRRDEPAPPAPEQLNAKVKAVKQAVQMLSESVEDEVASLRAADGKGDATKERPPKRMRGVHKKSVFSECSGPRNRV